MIICLLPSFSDYSQTGISLICIEMNILKVSAVLKGACAPLGLQIYCTSKEHCSNEAAAIVYNEEKRSKRKGFCLHMFITKN